MIPMPWMIRKSETKKNRKSASGVSLESCFPDDPDVVPAVLADLAKDGVAYYGGGASPLFTFVPASAGKR